MDPFALPDELPSGIEELTALRAAASDAFTRLRGKVDAGETLSDDELAELRAVVAAGKTLDVALAAAEAPGRAAERADEINVLIAEGATASVDTGDDDDADDEAEEVDDVVEEAEAIVDEAVSVTAGAAKGKAVARTTFAGIQKGKKAHIPRGTDSGQGDVGFRMKESMVNQVKGLVGFKEIAESLAAVKKGHRPVGNISSAGAFNSL